jgi:hypothetical protein
MPCNGAARVTVPIVGLIGRKPFPEALEDALAAWLGEPWLRSPEWDFTATRYYDDELGSPLTRGFRAFAPRVPELAEWKRTARGLESRWRGDSGRRVNIDPGFVGSGGLFLASTKPGGHRVPLAPGIFAEITRYYHRGRWVALPWTFPDYASGLYDAFLTQCRAHLIESLRGEDRSDAKKA